MKHKAFSTALLAAATVGVITLTGCSGSGPDSAATTSAAAVATGTPATGPHDAADVAFATAMIPHHAQAVEMADLAATRAGSDEVTSLAASIKAAQDPEIATMSGWLAGWGEPVPTSTGAMSSMEHGTGMMSAADMDALAKASGAPFDRMWVSMMIEHHTGALAMATTEIADGSNPDALALAHSIVTTQTAEIARMRSLLTTLPAS